MRADYHIHTSFSVDSNENLEYIAEQAIKKGIDEICITDHVDYGTQLDKKEGLKAGRTGDMNVDYDAYFPMLALFKEKYKERLTIKTGLEFGIQTITVPEYQKLYDRYPLDFVILSCHQVGIKNFGRVNFKKVRYKMNTNICTMKRFIRSFRDIKIIRF